MSPHRLLPLLAAAAALSCGSSSSSGTPAGAPVIDSLTVPSTFTVSGSNYTVMGTLTFHDDHAAVPTLREKIPSYGQDVKTTINASEGQQAATITLGFASSQAVPSGTKVEIDVSVIDANGVESNVEMEQITVP